MNKPDILTEAPTGTEYRLNGKASGGIKPAGLSDMSEAWLSKEGQPKPISLLIQSLTDLFGGYRDTVDGVRLWSVMSWSEKLALAELNEAKKEKEVPSSAVQISPVAKAAARDYAKEWRRLDQAIIKKHGSNTGQPKAASAKPVTPQSVQVEDTGQRPPQIDYVGRLTWYLEHPVSEGPTSGIYEIILKELAAEGAPARVRSSIVSDPPGEQEPELSSNNQSAYLVNATQLSDSSVDPEYGESPARELYNKKVKELDKVKQVAAKAIEEIRWSCRTVREISDLLRTGIGMVVRLPAARIVLADFRKRLVQKGAILALVNSGPEEFVTEKIPLSIIQRDTVYKLERDLFELLQLSKKGIITEEDYERIFDWTQAEEVKRVLGEIKNPED